MLTGTSISLSPTERVSLVEIAADHNSPQKHVWRTQIVLLLVDGVGTNETCASQARPRPAFHPSAAVIQRFGPAPQQDADELSLTVLPWLVCSYLPLAPAILTHADLRYAFPSFFVVLAVIVRVSVSAFHSVVAELAGHPIPDHAVAVAQDHRLTFDYHGDPTHRASQAPTMVGAR